MKLPSKLSNHHPRAIQILYAEAGAKMTLEAIEKSMNIHITLDRLGYMGEVQLQQMVDYVHGRNAERLLGLMGSRPRRNK